MELPRQATAARHERTSQTPSPPYPPDGHWLAYNSNLSGRNEVYVERYPELRRGRRQLSATGGAPAGLVARRHGNCSSPQPITDRS